MAAGCVNRVSPSVEVLEDRCLLSAGLAGHRHAAHAPRGHHTQGGHHRHPITINYVPPANVPAPAFTPAAPAAVTGAPQDQPATAPAAVLTAPPPPQSQPAPAPTQTASAIPSTAAYDVTITGIADGQLFQRTGRLVVVPTVPTLTTNGTNGREVLLVSGNPATNPDVGSIWFGTNRALFAPLGDAAAASAIDLAFVSVDEQGGHITIHPDFNQSRASVLNEFNTRSGLLANVYEIQGGTVQLDSQNGGQTVSGRIDISGSGYIYPSNTPYAAVISGTRVA